MSDIIRLLPDAIANQIAAGEVVQRPASVVKELLENAIDAGASQVQVLVREAGKNCIQVIDNGRGMSETDARMSFERHATSKISTSDDLFSIRTKGFRGEALASIAAVAQVEMRTRTAEHELGTKICIEGSEVKLQEPEATPEGTFLSVKNLFFNVPARRNFLKSNAVEMRHIMDEFIRVALAHPDVAFSLHQNDMETFQLTPGKLSQRIVQLFGKNYKEQLAACQEETPHVRIAGYIGKPEAAKKTRGEQFFFLNNRYIRNNYLHHAIMQAYEGLLQSDTYPFYVLFLEMDPKDIDINVHPTKTEVKFADERTVYAIVHSAVRQAIGTHNLTPSLNFDQDVNFTSFLSGSSRPENQQQSPKVSSQQQDRSWSQFGSSHPREDTNLKNWQRLFDAPEAPRQDPLPFPEKDQPTTVIQPSRAFGEAVTFESAANQLPGENTQPGIIAEGELNAFQLHQRYIVSQVKSGMILFDQAATHERILYEKFLQQLRQRSGSSQQFLFPQQLQLNPQDFALVNDLMEEIQALGFDVEPFGQQTLKINGLPADLSGQDAGPLFEGLIEQFKQYRSELSLGTHEGMARALAVRSGIRAGQQLSSLEMRTLIDQLFACENPNHAPDGRRTFVVLDLEKIASFFI